MADNEIDSKFEPIKEKMEAENLSTLAINNFKHYYSRLVKEGKRGGLIPDSDIEPVDEIPCFKDVKGHYDKIGRRAQAKTVMIKLNGGLGTSMGLDKAKSLLKVKNGYTFLDIIIKQAVRDDIPLILMNSFRTRKDCLPRLQQDQELETDVPFDFVQHKVPKILQDDLSPATFPKNRAHEWCPPGHGDIYNALLASGILDKLLDHNYEYAFVSNSDNLGGVVNNSILGYFSDNNLPFMMEVAKRTPDDKKGGHLAQTEDGQLLLRELSQCPREDLDNFQNIKKYKYFNTNNLWINLKSLKKEIDLSNNGLTLPMICNEKHVNPRDPDSSKVYQLETAMGAAISKFSASEAILVPPARFIPVKKTKSLLKIRSDIYILTDDFQIIENPERKVNECNIELDPDYYKLIDDMEERFPYGPPSLLHCKSFKVVGDVWFGKGVKVEGNVTIINSHAQQKIIENRILRGSIKL